MIVDCHTHWGDCFVGRDGTDPSLFLSVLDSHRVTHAVLLPFRGLVDPKRVVSDNNDLTEVGVNSEGRLIPFCTVHTGEGRNALSEVERCLGQLGMKGVKIHPWLQGSCILDPLVDEICEVAGGFGVPVLFHDGTPPYSLPSQIALLAGRHPETQIVLGHAGLLEFWREALYALSRQSNLWACLSGPHLEAMSQIIDRGPSARILWGTDFGISEADSYDYRLGLLHELGLSDAQNNRILAENPRRLLRI